MIDYSQSATWQSLYDLDAEPQAMVYRPHVRLSYHRAVLAALMREHVEAYQRALGWLPTQRTVILGCGYGWSIEQLLAHGYVNVIGCDNSSLIQAQKDQTEEDDIDAAIRAVGIDPTTGEGAGVKASLFDGGPRSRVPVLNEDGLTASSRDALTSACDGAVDVVLTEDVLEAYADEDCVTLSTALHQLAPVVQHLVSVDQGQIFAGNWKSIEQWKALLPNDTFLEIGTYRML